MVWLYRLQQRLSMTRHEGMAALTLAVLFVIGLTVRHVRKQQRPPLAPDSVVAQASTAPEAAAASAPEGPSPRNPVRLNEASARRLQALDGIGPALSERIIEYRSTQRPFQRPAELKRVRGIGPKTMDALRPVVTVSEAGD